MRSVKTCYNREILYWVDHRACFSIRDVCLQGWQGLWKELPAAVKVTVKASSLPQPSSPGDQVQCGWQGPETHWQNGSIPNVGRTLGLWSFITKITSQSSRHNLHSDGSSMWVLPPVLLCANGLSDLQKGEPWKVERVASSGWGQKGGCVRRHLASFESQAWEGINNMRWGNLYTSQHAKQAKL